MSSDPTPIPTPAPSPTPACPDRLWALCLFATALASGSAFAQADVTKMVWTGPSQRVVIGVAVFVVAVAVLVVVTYLIGSRRRGKNEHDLSAKLFNEGCERCRLVREEVNVLLGMVAFAPEPPTKGHLIFESMLLYERCLDAYAGRTLRLTASAGRISEQEELLLSLRKKMGYGVIAADQRLFSTRNMGVGQKVTLVVPGPGGGQKPHSIGALISHMGEFWFTVRIVEDFGGLVSVGGAEIRLAFLREGDAAYSVSARVRDAESGGLINFFHTLKLLRNQHRQYMRLDINMPIKYKLIERIDSDEGTGSEEFSAHTIDISGGGVCFIADVPLAAGDIILLTLNIPGATLIGIRSKILKVLPVEGKGAAVRYRHLVQFVLIEQQQREKIVKFIFEKQRTLLQMR